MLMRLRNVNMGSNGDMYQNNYFNKNNRSFEGSFRVSMVTYSFDFCFRLFSFFTIIFHFQIVCCYTVPPWLQHSTLILMLTLKYERLNLS